MEGAVVADPYPAVVSAPVATEGSIPTKGYYYDAGGHWMQHSDDGNYFREFDIYKFLPKDYNNRYNVSDFIKRLGIKIVDNNFDPIVVSTPWYNSITGIFPNPKTVVGLHNSPREIPEYLTNFMDKFIKGPKVKQVNSTEYLTDFMDKFKYNSPKLFKEPKVKSINSTDNLINDEFEPF